jgi:3-oxoacyl-[acyl-carrier protein] reductase
VNNPPCRVAIVTGGGRGIGAAVAERLAADGCSVGVLDLDEPAAKATAESINGLGGSAVAVGGDVTEPEQVSTAVAFVVQELGAPTVLVNNAGVTRDALLFKMTEPDWDTVIGVHLRGAFLMTRAVQHYMTLAGWGRVVTISSTSALATGVRRITRRPRLACRASPRRSRSSSANSASPPTALPLDSSLPT